ncbi:protein kinase domain-containing protein [Nocardia sp. IBHARD005]|uniref:protein kinase domain-containing protein n=1 Tax=Nocardia sp. IBHARD005 TaxID=3457765 RepID=UPI004059E64C
MEGILGQGGMGTVYLAKHPRLPRSVALKLLNREFSADQELHRRFEREADVVAQLDHPSIVGVYDRGSDDGYLWIAMQFIRGTDAATWDSRAHEPGVTARLIGETAAALDYANRHAVLHRDVKPGNILIADAEHGRETRAVLTDFGIARVTTANTQLTATGTFTATLAYASPEQLSGEIVDHRSDQYSLACTLFAIYAGHPPYTATNPGQVVAGHLSQPVPRLTTVRTDLPPAVDSVIARAMAKRPGERFSSATEFTDAIRNALEGRHIAAPTVRQPWTDPARHGHGSGEHGQRRWADPVQQRHGFSGHGQGQWPEQFDNGAWQQPGPGAMVADPRLAPAAFAQPWQQAAPTGRVPSRGTAMTAGIGALLIGVVLLCLTVFATFLTSQASSNGLNTDGNAIAIALFGFAGIFGTAAGVLLLQGRTAGRVMAMIVTAPVLLYALGCVIVATAEEVYLGTLGASVGFLIAAGLIGCAAAPSTGRWIRYRKALRANRW